MSLEWIGANIRVSKNPVLNKALSVIDLQAMKQRNEKISCLTAYDASFSALIDAVGIDIMLIGDSLGMVIQGHTTTLPVSLDDIIYHTRCVVQAKNRAFVIADLPFMSYCTPVQAAQNAGRLLSEAGAQMVKLEGPRFEVIRFLVDQGIPVCAHLGLQPQSINLLGDYKARGQTAHEAQQILEQAGDLERAGASILLLECIPADLAKEITCQLDIPVIGIGAGVACDGQILVVYDMLNISTGKKPRFAKNFMQGRDSIEAALSAYHISVKNGEFPGPEHSY